MPRMDDLDPATRKAVEQAIGRRSSKGGGHRTERQRARPSAASAAATGGVIGSCECGQTFTNENQVKNHPTGPGHGRYSCTLTRAADAGQAETPVTPEP